MSNLVSKIIFITVITFLFSINTIAQVEITKSNDIETFEGKTYYMHKVGKKETMFSISKAYEVTIEEIEAVNPELKDGLKAKSTIKIPYEKNYVFHYVKKKETMFGISKQYNVSKEEIIDANPKLVNGLKYGQMIKIPLKKNKIEKAEPVEDTVKSDPKAIKDSIANDSIIEMLSRKRPEINCSEARKKEVYKIGIMVPFYSDDMNTVIPSSVERKTKTYKSFTFLPFYQGALLAIDSMKKTKQKFEFFVYDIDNDTNTIKEVFAKPEIAQLDLLIGPFFPNALTYAVEKLKNSDTKIISPLAPDNKVLKNNINTIQIRPSRREHIKQLVHFVAENYVGENIIFIYDGKETSTKILENIKSDLLDTLNYPKFKNFKYKELVFKNFFKEDDLSTRGAEIKSIKPIEKEMVGNKKNIIISLIRKNNYTIDFINKLNLLHDTLIDNTIVIGLPTWKKIEQLDYEKFQNLNTHISTTCLVDYEDEKTISFIKEYRNRFKTEPREYAFLGYDVTSYFLNAMLSYGVDFDKCLDKIDYNLISTKFEFFSNGFDGWENKYISIFRYDNYEMIDAKADIKKKNILKDVDIN